MTVNAFINEPFVKRTITEFEFKDVTLSKKKLLLLVGARQDYLPRCN